MIGQLATGGLPPSPRLCMYVYTEYLMATKTISIDLEAYERLKSVQKEHESFSQTIKRVVPKRIDFEQWLASIEQDPLSDDAVAAVEEVVARGRSPQNMGRPAARQPEPAAGRGADRPRDTPDQAGKKQRKGRRRGAA